MNRARSNPIQARAEFPGVYYEDLCFLAPQAAEKAIKTVLIAGDIAFPYVHDLVLLAALLTEDGNAIPVSFRDLTWLTPFAARLRYPFAAKPASAEDHDRAIAIAERIIAWADGRVKERMGTA